jgi:hypothetical protein
MTEESAESDPMSQSDNARLRLKYDGYRKRFAAPRKTDVHSAVQKFSDWIFYRDPTNAIYRATTELRSSNRFS